THRPLHSFPTRRSSDLLSKPRASYEISEGQLHANSGSDGWIKDLRTGVTVSINNIKGFVFGDGATMLFQSDVSSTVEVTGYDTRSEEHTSELQSRENLV